MSKIEEQEGTIPISNMYTSPIFAQIAQRRHAEFLMLTDMSMLLHDTISLNEAKENAKSVMVRKYGEHWFTGEPPTWREEKI